MDISKSTDELLTSLDILSQFKLTRREDLGILIELASVNNQRDLLERLGFLAKFASKTMGIMSRIGSEGRGYDKLTREFSGAIKSTTALLRTLIQNAPEEIRQRFSLTYLSMTSDSLQQLLVLCYDLSWYKNRLIDRPDQNPSGVP